MNKNTHTLTIRVRDFNLVATEPETIKQLRKLTLNQYSGMNAELTALTKESKYRTVEAQVLMAYHREKVGDNPKLVGWALFSREPSSSSFYTSGEFFNTHDGVLLEIFVDPAFRRKGIGTEIIKLAKRKAGTHRLCVAPWDDRSIGFYEKFNHYGAKWL
jgi:ribosomal protein S18 acetylase RimI-like enzyme